MVRKRLTKTTAMLLAITMTLTMFANTAFSEERFDNGVVYSIDEEDVTVETIDGKSDHIVGEDSNSPDEDSDFSDEESDLPV